MGDWNYSGQEGTFVDQAEKRRHQINANRRSRNLRALSVAEMAERADLCRRYYAAGGEERAQLGRAIADLDGREPPETPTLDFRRRAAEGSSDVDFDDMDTKWALRG